MGLRLFSGQAVRMGPFSQWLIFAPLWLVALTLVVGLTIFVLLGAWMRQRMAAKGQLDRLGSDQEGYVLGAVSGLLALLIGFTFSMAIDRFDTRRARVLEESNAIEATYLKAQILPEPYRTQLSNLLVRYVDNKIVLGEAKPGPSRDKLLAKSEALETEIWSATLGVFPTIKSLDFSSSFVDTVSSVMQADAARKEGRRSHVPGQVFAVLFVYQLVTAGVFGFVMSGRQERFIAAFLLLLFAMSMILVVEIDRPVTGRINEAQDAMVELQTTLHSKPPRVFGHSASATETP